MTVTDTRCQFYYAADAIVIDGLKNPWEILLIKRRKDSRAFPGMWALPGGHVDNNETSEQAAKRELKEETGLDVKDDEPVLVGVFDKPGRDPRGPYVSVVYLFFLDSELEVILNANDDAQDLAWFAVDKLPELAFDHREMIEKALTFDVDATKF